MSCYRISLIFAKKNYKRFPAAERCFMNKFTINMLVLTAAFCLLLSGCRSSKGASSHGGYGKPGSSHVDYAREYAGPMGKDLAEEARRWLGTPYRYGGQDRNGTDCSGLVLEIYRSVCAVKIPRTTSEQKSYCTQVARNKTQVGDLVFFGGGKGVSHVGLYIGKGEMIHASSSRGVVVSNIDTGYWGERFKGAGRVAGAEQAWAANTSRKKKNRKPEKPSAPQAPPVMEIPSVDRPLGVPSVSVSELAAVMEKRGASSAAGQAADDGKKNNADPQTVSNEIAAIEQLDMIIDEKVDSIFSTRFMD